MINQDDAERAVEYLMTSATPAAQARAERIYVEQFLKVVKSQESAKSEGKTVSEREIDAYLSDAYKAALDAYRAAVEADEKLRFLREAASARLEAFRTQEASMRATRL